MTTSPLSVNKFRLIFIGGWIIWTIMHGIVLYRLGFTFPIVLVDSLVFNVLLAATCILIINNLKYYLPGKEKQWYILVLAIGLSALWLFISKWFIGFFQIDSADYGHFLSKSLPVRFGIGFLFITCVGIASMLWYATQEQKEQEQRKSDAERLAREAELYKLRQQLQPHFLFNSLNSINALIGTRPEEARHMVQQLSDFLRGTLRKEDNQWVSYEEELGYLQLYLDIEKVRFGHRLSTSIETDELSSQMMLPPMLLQPIVENAIKFGLYDTTDDITIRIKSKVEEQQLVVTVQNPFDPQTAHPQKGTGFGLTSIQRRLQLLFGRNDLLETRAEDHLFTTIIKIPQ